METQTLQQTRQHSISSVPLSILSLGSWEGLGGFEEPSVSTTGWPHFIAEYDYQMENGNISHTSKPSPSPALSFQKLSSEVNRPIEENFTPTTFHRFSHLPVELRQHIWSFACQHERNVNIWFSTFVRPKYEFHPGNNLLSYESNTPDPDMLYVCKEARKEALKHYSLCFGTKHTSSWFTFETRPKIWCNLSVDTVCLTSNFLPRYTNSHYEDFLKKCAKSDMCYLAYNIYQFFSYRGYTSGVNWSKIFRIVDAYGERISELREIVFYYDDDEEMTNKNNVRSEFVALDWGAMDPDCRKIQSLQDVQRDLLRTFPEKAEFVEQGRSRERALDIWKEIQNKVIFMDIRVTVEA